MSKDKLEQYIINNKEEFDTLEPSKGLWEGISKIEPKPKKLDRPYFSWAMRVAATIIIFIGSYYFHDYRSQNRQTASFNSASNTDNKLYHELIEAEYYYTAQIGTETERFYQLAGGNKMLREEIQTELEELDNEFNTLKNDLRDNADNEEIIAAMIQNYRLKLRILQDMMNQLQQGKKENTNKDENNLIQI